MSHRFYRATNWIVDDPRLTVALLAAITTVAALGYFAARPRAGNFSVQRCRGWQRKHAAETKVSAFLDIGARYGDDALGQRCVASCIIAVAVRCCRREWRTIWLTEEGKPRTIV